MAQACPSPYVFILDYVSMAGMNILEVVGDSGFVAISPSPSIVYHRDGDHGLDLGCGYTGG